MPAYKMARLSFAALAMIVLSGCQGSEEAAAPQQAAPPPSEVGIVTVQPEAIPVISDLPGRISPTRIAEVRPRVGGIVTERIFEQGTDVEQGQPLFQIDAAPFEVAVAAAEASVARAEAVLLQATQEADRTRALVERRTVSEANLDAAVALQRQAEADLAAARASLSSAQLELDYSTVRAPIAGRIGRAIVTEGALVSTSAQEALATIQQLDPVYADIQQPVSELQRLREALRTGALTQIEPDVASVRLMLDDGSPYPHPGRLLFSEATVDPTSGQVTLRAEFPNPDGNLLPGMYVRVEVEEGVETAAIAVPNQAIQRDTAGRSQVYVVNGEGVVEVRPVTVTRVVGNRSVLGEGVAEGDRVIADGFQKIAPGAPVTPVEWTPPGEAAESLATGDAEPTEPGAGEPAAGSEAEPAEGAASGPTAEGTPAEEGAPAASEDEGAAQEQQAAGEESEQANPPRPTPRASAAATPAEAAE